MTYYAICGPLRHSFYVMERLKRQGIPQKGIRAVLTRSDLGNNARSAVALADEVGAEILWTGDSRDLLAAHIPDHSQLSGRSPTPVHALFNMFYQNARAAEHLPDATALVARMRSDMVLYEGCLARLQAAQAGLANNPIAQDSGYVSDQFMAFPQATFARIWATEGFAESFTAAEGIPETMIRTRVQQLLGAPGFAFERFVDFDIIYEQPRWSDSPRVFWIKRVFGWQGCYAALDRKGPVTRWIERHHHKSLRHGSWRHKALNLGLKLVYLPLFALRAPGIFRDLQRFPRPIPASGGRGA